MNNALIAGLFFGVPFGSFILFILALRFIPQAKRQAMFKFNIPLWRSLPKQTQEYLVGAGYLVSIGAISGWPIRFGPEWANNLFWATVALFVGIGLGHWQAARKTTPTLD
jgi:hypothetical protein